MVRLVTDGQSKVGVTFGNQLTGIVDGQGPSNSMTADLVPPHTPLHKGRDDVHQRPRRGVVPAGHPGGHACGPSTPRPGASQETITVDPAADLNQLAYVDVVQWVPPT